MSLPIVNPFMSVPGELSVTVERPPQRFGLGIYVFKRGPDGKLWQAVPDSRRELMALPTPIEPYSYPDKPTLYLDELVAEGLKNALNGMPPLYVKGEETVTHLKDAIAVRDRLLALVEAAAPRAGERG